jgi:hypothetical protein
MARVDCKARGERRCNFAFSCMEHDKVMRAMQLFATEVMPHFI